ncbi:MAG: hypothetical protein ABEJ92_06975 [Halobacteriales archaeon]
MSGRPVGRREVAYRLFAAEYEDADLEYSDSEEERAPNYVVTPTGARVNRLFAVGVLTEVEPVSDDVLRARVADPTGAFVVYAGQYQPEAVAFLEDADVPSFVAVTGKARTFQPDGTDRVFTSVRPESMTAVEADTRDRWTVQAAEHTLARVATVAWALDREERGEALAEALRAEGVAPGLAAGVPLAIDHYGTTRGYLAAVRAQAVAAVEVVAGRRESVPELDRGPGEDGPVSTDLTAAPAVPGTLTGEPGVEPAATEGTATGSGAVGPDEAGEPPGPAAEGTGGADGPSPAPDSTEAAAPTAAEDPGDFEAPDVAVDAADDPAVEYELDEAEREQVEAEYGTEFSTGNEVDDPGAADIEAPTEPPSTGEEPDGPGTEESAGETGGSDASPSAEAGPAGEDPAEAPEPGDSPVGEAPGGPDLEDVAVEVMAELDEGDGATREAVVAAVVDETGADSDAVEDAIQDALMGGRCYEPSDGRLKAI